MISIGKLSKDAKLKLGISSDDNRPFIVRLKTITAEELKKRRNPNTPYVVI